MRTEQSSGATSGFRPGRTLVGSIALWALIAGCANTSLPGATGPGFSESQQVATDQPGNGQSVSAGTAPGTVGSPGTGPGMAGSGAGTAPGNSTSGATVGSAAGGSTGTGKGAGSGSSGQGAPTIAPVPGSTVGVTKTQITIQASGPFSGVYSAITDQVYRNAFQVWQNEINAQGGIYGRKIRFLKVDNQLTPAGAVAACKAAQGNGSFMVWNMLGSTNEVDCENAARIPVVDTASSYVRKDWSYAVTVQFPAQAGKPIVSLMKSHWMNWQSKKIGLLYSSDSPFSVAEFNAVKDAMGTAGLPVVHSEAVTANQSSYVPQMSRMKSSGADAVALLCFCVDANHIISDARAVGYSPQWLGATSVSSDVAAKIGGPLFDGMFGARYSATADSPAYATFKSKVQKYGGDPNQADTNQMFFYGGLDALGEALRRAGPDLTREGLMAAIHKLVNYDRHHMIAPITWKGSNVGMTARFPARCCATDYTWKGLGPAAETFR